MKKAKKISLVLVAAAVALPLLYLLASTALAFRTPVAPLEDGVGTDVDPDLVNLLFVGCDTTARRTADENGLQADTLVLFTLDPQSGGVVATAIPRDIPMAGTQPADGQILSFAYSLFETDEANMRAAAREVGELLQIPVHGVVQMDIDGIAAANHLVGGVEVALTEDLTAIAPALQAGMRVRLEDDWAEEYVRARRLPGMNGSNVARMQRQSSFMRAFVASFKTCQRQNPLFAFQFLAGMKGYVATTLTPGEMLNLLGKLNRIDFDAASLLILPGAQQADYYELDEAGLARMRELVFC